MPVSKDPHCKCGKAIVGTIKDGVRHGLHCCIAIGQEVPNDRRKYSKLFRSLYPNPPTNETFNLPDLKDKKS